MRERKDPVFKPEVWTSADGVWKITVTTTPLDLSCGPIGVRAVIENGDASWIRFWGIREFRMRGARDDYPGVPLEVSERAD